MLTQQTELISVIVPIYKVEKYLEKCVDSILAQTYSNLEIILVDDGSPDLCSKICDDYLEKDSRIRVIHQDNAGLSAARNRGIANANGRYIGFVDSDDYIDKRMYELLYKAIIENSADIAVCSYNRVDEKCNLIPAISPIQNGVYTSYEMLEKLQKKQWGYYITAWNKLYKREIFEDIQFPQGKIYEDMYIMHQLYYKCNRIVTIKDALYNYVKRQGSIVASEKTPRHLDDIEARIQRFYFYKDKGYRNLYEDFFDELIGAYERRRAPIKISSLKDMQRVYLIDKDLRKLVFTNYEKIKWTDYIKYRIPGIWITTKKISGKVFGKIKLLLVLAKYSIRLCGSSFVLLDTPMHQNIGDHAIALAERQMLDRLFPEKRYVELTGREIKHCEKYLAKLTPKSKVVLVHGGGFLGSLWPEEEERFRRILQAFSQHRIIVFPQTVTFDTSSAEGIRYLENSKMIYEKHTNLTVFVRELNSFRFMKEHFSKVDVRLVPDIVLQLQIDNRVEREERRNILCCLRNDQEKNIDSQQLDKLLSDIKNALGEKLIFTDTVLTDRNVVEKHEREKYVLKKLSEFANAKLVVTDRLHGMVFAALVGTTCIAIGNTNGKVKGVYTWLSKLPYIYYLEFVEDINKVLDDLKLNGDYDYNLTIKEFEPLVSTLKSELG